MIWVIVVVLVMGLIGFVCFDVGVSVGRALEDRDRRERLGSMSRHPSNHLRSVKEE